jgi:LmeA-like phospholipid-binding
MIMMSHVLMCVLMGLVIVGCELVASPPVLAEGPTLVISAGSSVYAPPKGKIDELLFRLKGATIVDWQASQALLTLRQVDLPTGSIGSFAFDGIEVQAAGLQLQSANLQANKVVVDAFQLLNFRRLVLASPTTANLQMVLSDQALTAFLNTEKNRQAIEKSLTRLTGGLIPTQVVQTKVAFAGKQMVNLQVDIAMGAAVTMPITGSAKLVLVNGTPKLEGLQLNSLGIQLPPELAPVLANQLSDALNPARLLKGNGSVTLSSLSMAPGALTLSGQATLNKLDLQSKI